MNDLLSMYDAWLNDGGPAALVIRERLMPVEGRDGVVFPATFAPEQGNDPSRFRGGYNIDGPFNGQPGGENICLIDSVGSQANRVEPVFAQKRYQGLVPQVVIKAGDDRKVNLLDAGHRAGDAIARCTSLRSDINCAFKSLLAGDAAALAKIAPTSLVFGVWDSRDTQAKVPRVVGSTIRAFNVRKLTRGAVYTPPLDYTALEVFSEADKVKAEDDPKSPLAKRGFVHNPASGAHGGVIATGGIRRDATLNLAALCLLKSGSDDGATLSLRRYILGLSLVAFTHPSAFVGYLRQGCTLVLDPDAKPAPREFSLVHPNGRREPQSLTHDEAFAYAEAAAKAFKVGESREAPFKKDAAKRDVPDAKQDKKGKKNKKGAEAASVDASVDSN